MTMKTAKPLAAALLAGMLALAATPAQAHEFFTGKLTVIHPWTSATEPGQTSAVVSLKFEDVTESDRLVSVRTPVAEGAELGGEGASATLDFEIPAGRETQLRADGTYLRLTGLTMPLHQGREYPLTLVFEKAGPIRCALLIDFGSD